MMMYTGLQMTLGLGSTDTPTNLCICNVKTVLILTYWASLFSLFIVGVTLLPGFLWMKRTTLAHREPTHAAYVFAMILTINSYVVLLYYIWIVTLF